jgi:hypothetical protein
VVHELLLRGLPARPPGARSSLVPLRALLARWWAEDVSPGPPAEGESRFYERIRAVASELTSTRLAPRRAA